MSRHLRRYGAIAAALVGTLLAAGCDPPSSTADAAQTVAQDVIASAPPAQVPASGVALSGDVKNPRVITLEEMRKLPQQTVQGTFKTHHGTTSHKDVGPLLAKLVTMEDLAVTDRKNDQVSFVIVARADNGYTVSYSFGEFAPDMGNGGIIVSLVRDGKRQERPGIVVPGDKSAFRHLHSLVELRVVRLS
jgi:hypothetical protein